MLRIVPLLIFLLDYSSGLQYNFGDGSYYVGSVDNQGRPSGLGHYYDSSGQLGTFNYHDIMSQ